MNLLYISNKYYKMNNIDEDTFVKSIINNKKYNNNKIIMIIEEINKTNYNLITISSEELINIIISSEFQLLQKKYHDKLPPKFFLMADFAFHDFINSFCVIICSVGVRYYSIINNEIVHVDVDEYVYIWHLFNKYFDEYFKQDDLIIKFNDTKKLMNYICQ